MNATEIHDWLERATRAHALGALDVELGHFVLGREPAQPVLALVAALASRAVAAGHACLPLDQVAAFMASIMPAGVAAPRLPSAPELQAAAQASTQCTLACAVGDARTPLWLDAEGRLYLTRYARHEARVAAGIRRLLDTPWPAPDAEGVVWLREHLADFRHAPGADIDWQGVAVLSGWRSPFTVISGGPGTGKTTSVLWLLRLLVRYALEHDQEAPLIALAAPTGKAAARLGESLRQGLARQNVDAAVREALPTVATTLHRLLGVRRGSARFHHHQGNPLAADVVVVDEASMVDLPLMARLLDALKPGARLVLLGDRDQLASVEAGQVLAGICAAAGAGAVSPHKAAWVRQVLDAELLADDAAPALADAVVTLRVSHRFGADSGVGTLATAVREGNAEAVCRGLHEQSFEQVQWLPHQDALDTVLEQTLPSLAAVCAADGVEQALQAADALRILTAVREGPRGCVAINAAIEEVLRRQAGVGRLQRWYPGRLLLVTENAPDVDLFNGDVGIVWADDHGRLAAWFPASDGLQAVPLSALPAHETGFAMTIHKSQGSEFDEVIVVLPAGGHRMLGRELLYTAITRARQAVTLVADDAAVRRAVQSQTRRFGGLADRLAVNP